MLVAETAADLGGWILVAQLVTPVSILIGAAAIFVRIGRREEQLDNLTTAVGGMDKAVDALTRIASRMERFEQDTDRRLAEIERTRFRPFRATEGG